MSKMGGRGVEVPVAECAGSVYNKDTSRGDSYRVLRDTYRVLRDPLGRTLL